jgi:hypothetical protein
MHLKPYLRKTLNDKIEGYKSRMDLTEESLRVLEKTNTGRANYVVHLEALWANEGESSTTTEHSGTLKDAIERAEAEFKSTNHRSDVQADCSVAICLGDDRYSIPQEYWQKFQARYREK